MYVPTQIKIIFLKEMLTYFQVYLKQNKDTILENVHKSRVLTLKCSDTCRIYI